jgi:ribosomal-protein-alanine N-acetyltransferase
MRKVRYNRKDLQLPPGPITTRRLLLRSLRPSDVDLVWAMDSDPGVMKYVAPIARHREEHRLQFLRDLAAGERFRFFYALQWLEDDPALGWVFARPTEDGEWIELGYRLAQANWGQGIVPEAAAAMLDSVCGHWQADRVMALLDRGNSKSERVMGKLGFSLIGTTDRYYGMSLLLYVRARHALPQSPI